MRYDKLVEFVTTGQKIYNEDTGDYEMKGEQVVKRMASISNTGEEKLNLLFGKIDQDMLTIRIKTPIIGHFSFVKYKGVDYVVKYAKNLRQEQVFYLAVKQ